MPPAPRPHRRAWLAAFLTLASGIGVLLAAAWWGATPRAEAAPWSIRAPEAKDACTVIFVRHAEKDPSGDPKDPGLGDPGRKRAAALSRLLAQAGVSRLYASEFKRAQETLAPLAQRVAQKIEIVPAGDPARLIAALSSAPAGSVAVVAGHSNTLPALIEKLGGHVGDLLATPQGPQLRETEFDRMFVVTLGPPEKSGERESRTALTTLELRYGD